jgi:hypothetical protein
MEWMIAYSHREDSHGRDHWNVCSIEGKCIKCSYYARRMNSVLSAVDDLLSLYIPYHEEYKAPSSIAPSL